MKDRMKSYDEVRAELQIQFEQNPSMLCPRQEISRFLAHYEIFKLALNIPGSFAEVGVYKGAALLTWVQLLNIFAPGDTSRKVYGFDNFKGFEKIHEKDGKEIPSAGKHAGGWNPTTFYPHLLELIKKIENSKMLPKSKTVHLIEGDISLTAPEFKKNHPGVQFSLLHIDVDLYEPTLSSLEHLYPLVSPGGVVIIDEYALAHWGATKALQDFFKGKLPEMKKLNFYTNPGGYFIKPYDVNNKNSSKKKNSKMSRKSKK